MNKKTEKYNLNKKQNDILEIHCIECKRSTRQKVIVSYDHNASEFDESEQWSVDWYSSHQVIQCQGCMTTTFRAINCFSEDQQQIGSNEWDDGCRETLFPKRSNNTLPIKDFWDVPNNLRRIYRETIDSFNIDSNVLTAAGLRAIVEGLCAALGIIDGPKEITKKNGTKVVKRFKNLEGKIAGLYEKGFLTKKSSTILHEHRFLGNEAVHELSQPSKDQQHRGQVPNCE